MRRHTWHAPVLGAALVLAGLCNMGPDGPRPGIAQAAQSAQTSIITYYYPTGNPTYSGQWPYWGSAAASWNIPLGSIVELPDGHVVVITDRGRLGWGNWIDVYCPWELARYCAYQYSYHRGAIVIHRWGW
jgi:3D (Asp-Asp-Asp) domain-containing protein